MKLTKLQRTFVDQLDAELRQFDLVSAQTRFTGELDAELRQRVGLSAATLANHYDDDLWWFDGYMNNQTAEEIVAGINFDEPEFDYLFLEATS